MEELLPKFFGKLSKVKNFDEFWQLFNSQSTETQILLGIGALGILISLYIFVVALFVDKHI